jgi:hypothetical protein
MNIYFACSITGGRDDQVIYQSIVSALQEDGHEIPTALLATPGVMELEGIVDPFEVYQRDVSWIEASDLLVAEVSTPSHGVGYEIGYALGRGVPVLCLFRQGVNVSKMILGNRDRNLHLYAYRNEDEAVDFLRAHITAHFT